MFDTVMVLLSQARQEHKGNDKPPKPLSSSRQQVLALIHLLEPMAEATDTLQGNGVTSSLIIPALIGTYLGLFQLIQ